MHGHNASLVVVVCLMIAGCGVTKDSGFSTEVPEGMVSPVHLKYLSSTTAEIGSDIANSSDSNSCIWVIDAAIRFPDGSDAAYAFIESGGIANGNLDMVLFIPTGVRMEISQRNRLKTIDSINIQYMGMSSERAAAEDKAFKDKVRKGNFVFHPYIQFFACAPKDGAKAPLAPQVIARSEVEALSDVVTINFDPIAVHLSQ